VRSGEIAPEAANRSASSRDASSSASTPWPFRTARWVRVTWSRLFAQPAHAQTAALPRDRRVFTPQAATSSPQDRNCPHRTGKNPAAGPSAAELPSFYATWRTASEFVCDFDP